MLISSDRDAAQSRSADGVTRFYDDIGCLAADHQKSAPGDVSYVHLASGTWTTPENAWFAVDPAHNTPMDYNVVAYATLEDAERIDRERLARAWSAIKTYTEHR